LPIITSDKLVMSCGNSKIFTYAFCKSGALQVPVLDLPSNPYNEVVLAPSLDELREFFHAVPQGEERATSIRIGALSPSHCLLAKIVQHNLWPVARWSDWLWKRPSLCMPFTFAYLSACANILWLWCWRLVMSIIPVSHLAAYSLRSFFSSASSLLESPRWRFSSLSANKHWWSQMRNCGERILMMTYLLPCQLLF
jgi:hypothetical protein